MSHSHDDAEVATHVPDFHWLIALWLAVHGGDPATEEEQVSDEKVQRAMDGITAAMAPETRANKSGTGASADQLRKIGVTVYKPKAAHGAATPAYCIRVGNYIHCYRDW